MLVHYDIDDLISLCLRLINSIDALSIYLIEVSTVF